MVDATYVRKTDGCDCIFDLFQSVLMRFFRLDLIRELLFLLGAVRNVGRFHWSQAAILKFKFFALSRARMFHNPFKRVRFKTQRNHGPVIRVSK